MMTMRLTHAFLRGLLAGLLLIALPTLAQVVPPTQPTGPQPGTTLIDPLAIPNKGDIRTLPKLPRVGAWSVLVGRPGTSAQGRGVLIDTVGQAVVYPTTQLLSGPLGTIEFSLIATTATDPNDATPRTLLDSWSANGPSRFLLSLTGAKLTLSLTDDKNQTKTIDAPVNWVANSLHKVTVLWSVEDLALLVDGNTVGKVEKAGLPAREPLGIVLGNARDLKNPAKVAVSDLRLSTAREPVMPVGADRGGEAISNDDLTVKMGADYQRRLNPLLDRLRQQNIMEVPFAYALSYSDIGDIDRAMQTVTPIARDANHPLNVQAVLLRADLLADQRDYNGAYEQLQVLTGSKDVEISVQAQVKQAMVLYEQGNTQESQRMIGEIIAKHPDLPAISNAYWVVALWKYAQGDFQNANRALDSIFTAGALPRQKTPINKPMQIKVSDADLNVRVSDVGLPVTVTSSSGDKEEVLLKPAFSRGVYVGNVDVTLGEPKKGDGFLQVQGNDTIQVTYIDRLSTDGVDVKRTYGVELGTDASLIMLAQAGLDIYREAMDYQKKFILDDNWNLIGKLPKSATAFFRNPEDGVLRKKGFRFDRSFIGNVKPGQSVYVELDEPDEDKTPNPDTLTVEVSARSGGKKIVTLTETGPRTGIFAATVKTTPQGQVKDDALEVTPNDVVIARYQDLRPAAGTGDPIRLSQVQIRSADGKITVGQEFPGENGEEEKVFIRAVRVSNGANVVVNIADRDLDNSDTADTVPVIVRTDSGTQLEVKATETGVHTGVFTVPLKISTSDTTASGTNVVKAKPGDRITTTFTDDENMTGKSVTREYTFRANIAEGAQLVFKRQIVEQQKALDKTARLQAQAPVKVTWEETTTLVPGTVYHVVLSDPDLIPTTPGEMKTKIQLKSSNGATVDVPLRSAVDGRAMQMTFQGDVFVRLGDAASPTRAYFSQTGSIVEISEEESGYGLWAVPAFNIQGKDKVDALYLEPLGADGKTKNVPLTLPLRIGADATIALLNLQGNPLELLKPGTQFELQVNDPNGDLTPKRDTLKVKLSSSCGDTLELELTETDLHSGIFSALVNTTYGTAATANDKLEVPFDGKLTVSYRDEETYLGTASDRVAEMTTRPLAESEGILLTKVYDDPKFEVETIVRLGESLYAVGAAELTTQTPAKDQPRGNGKLEEAGRLLQQVIDRFPNSEYVVECLYLTAKIRREEQKFAEAEKLYTRVIDEYPESDFVPQALYQLVLLAYDQKNIEKATEAAMRLVYGFPKNTLVSDAFLRIAEFYYGNKEYATSSYIYQRVIERFPDNPRIELIHYRMATALYRAGLAGDQVAMARAIQKYLEFSENYKDHELADDVLYWAAQAYVKQNDVRKAYTLVIKLLITYPTGDMAAYARNLRDKIKESNPAIEADEF